MEDVIDCDEESATDCGDLQLYGTNIYAVIRMAQHITEIMRIADKLGDSELVEQLASLSDRKHRSFASKFAHFFIDMERFPIYDSFAVKTVAHHLGKQGLARNTNYPYKAFIENINRLKMYAHLSCTNKELDRYLWLSGLYRTWLKNQSSHIGVEVVELFKSTSSAMTIELAKLLSG